jgi:O-antigen/teichoic acid export membrane protein
MIFNKNLKNISAIGIADITTNGIGGFFWFYLATLVLPTEFGEIHYFIGIASIASTLSLIGQQNTITVYISKNKSILSVLFLVSIISSIISFIVIFLFLGRFDVGLLVISFVIFAHGVASNLGYQDYKKYTTYSILQKGLMIIFSLSLFYIFGVEWVLLGIALSYFVYSKKFIDGLTKFKIDFSQFKENKKFILTNYSIMMTSITTSQIDKLLIMPILGFAVLGNYSLALQIMAIMNVIPSVVFKYILPRASQNIIDVKLRTYTIILSCISVLLMVILSPIIIPVFFEKYTDIVLIIQIMSFSVIPITINTFYLSKFLASEKASIPLIGGIVSSIVLIVGMIGLGSVYGITGIAVTHVLTYSVMCIISYIMDKKLNQIEESSN